MPRETGTTRRRAAVILSGGAGLLLGGLAVSCLSVWIIFRSDPAPVDELTWEDTLFGDLNERVAAPPPREIAPPAAFGVRSPGFEMSVGRNPNAETPAPRRLPTPEDEPIPQQASESHHAMLTHAAVDEPGEAASRVQSVDHRLGAAAWLGAEIEALENPDVVESTVDVTVGDVEAQPTSPSQSSSF